MFKDYLHQNLQKVENCMSQGQFCFFNVLGTKEA